MSNLLRNKKVLVTREQSQAKSLSEILSSHGAHPVEVPLLEINCLRIDNGRQRIIDRNYEWVFFTSAHGVQCFIDQFDINILKQCQIATVGHKTELALKQHGIQADFIPTTYNAVVMAKEFLERFPTANNLLLVRGSISRKELIEAFTKHKITFDTVTVYETICNENMKETLVQTLKEQRFDFLTFTSPSTVQAFKQFVQKDEFVNSFLQIPAVCIGTTTEKSAIKAGFTYTFIPKSFTIESMVDKIKEIVHMEG